MSKHLSIFGDFHRIITSSNVSVSHSSAGVAHRSVICLPNDSSCWNVVLMVLAQLQAQNSASGIPTLDHISAWILMPFNPWTASLNSAVHIESTAQLPCRLSRIGARISLNHPRRMNHDSSRASVLSFHLQLNTWAVQVLEHILQRHGLWVILYFLNLPAWPEEKQIELLVYVETSAENFSKRIREEC